MVLRTANGITTSEDVADLRVYVSALAGSPVVTESVLLTCGNHGDEAPAWTYIEADPREGVARRRCLQCAASVAVLDSAERWTHPPMWNCGTCHQSIAEVMAGLSVEDGEHVTWMALVCRCVECGRVDGLTDFVLPGLPRDEVLARL